MRAGGKREKRAKEKIHLVLIGCESGVISLSQSQTQTVQSKDILGDTLNHVLISYRLISFDRFRNNVKHIKIPYDDGCFYLTRAIAFGSVKVSSIFPLVDLELCSWRLHFSSNMNEEL